MSNNKIIVLDRDGVINYDSDAYVKSTEEWLPLPGSIEAIANLYKAGYRIFIATNQSGLARGYFTLDTLHAMHAKMLALIEEKGGRVEEILYCPHGPNDACTCRKPLPGMFRQIANSCNLDDLSSSYTVGDSLRDLEAGSLLNSQCVLVKTGKGERTLNSSKPLPAGTLIYDDLLSFVTALLNDDVPRET